MLLTNMKHAGRDLPLTYTGEDVRLGSKFWSAGAFLAALNKARAYGTAFCGTEVFHYYQGTLRIDTSRMRKGDLEKVRAALIAAGVEEKSEPSIRRRYAYAIKGGRSYNPW